MSETRRTIAASLLVAVVASILFCIHPQFFLKDDFLLQFLPGSRDVARAWSHASLPLLSPYSWVGSALGAEYQFGVFSIARALLDAIAWLLPLPLLGRAAFLFIAYAMIAGAGAYRLARSYDVRPAFAMMVALVASLNGWNLWWGTAWFVAVAAFAWIPWYWLALRGILRGTSRWSWLGAAITAYLIIAAGSPYVVVMAPFIAAMHFFTALFSARRRAALVMTLSSLLGLLLAAPAVLMLYELFRLGSRMSGQPRFGSMWVVPIESLFAAIVPAYSTQWPVFMEWMPHRGVELVGAFVPLAAIFAGFRRELLRRMRPELVLALFALVMAMLPSRAPLQWSFHWLPLAHLAFAILGACALESTRCAWAWGAGLVVLAIVAAAALQGDMRTVLIHGAVLIALCAMWAWFAREAMPVVITSIAIIATFTAFSHEGHVPVFTNHDVLLTRGPFDPGRRYLAMFDSTDVIGADAYGRRNRGMNLDMRPGNTPMIAGLHFLNGYSPLGFEGLATIFRFELHGTMPPDRAEEILRYESGRNQLLHHLGVDGLVVPAAIVARNTSLLARNGWRPIARVGDSVVLHRSERLANPLFQSAVALGVPDDAAGYRAIGERLTPQLPVVLLGAEPGMRRYWHREIANVRETRLATAFEVSGKGPRALVVFRRPWLPGLHATLNGEPLPVLRADMVMPAVELPPDAHGEVRLFYRPASLVLGAMLAGLGLLIIVAVAIRIRATWSRN